MPVRVQQVVDHVAAMEETPPDRSKLEKMVRETIGALGLAVASNDEVYDPAAGARSALPQQRNVRYAGMRRTR